MLCGQKQKRSFHSFRVKVALLRYIVFYCKLGCDTSEPHASTISRACSSLVRQPYYIPNRFILKIRGLVVVLTVRKVHWAGRVFYMDEYTLIFLFSRCIRCAQKRDCWESVRFASERSRVRIPLGPPFAASFLDDAAFLFLSIYDEFVSQRNVARAAFFGTISNSSPVVLSKTTMPAFDVPRPLWGACEGIICPERAVLILTE